MNSFLHSVISQRRIRILRSSLFSCSNTDLSSIPFQHAVNILFHHCQLSMKFGNFHRELNPCASVQHVMESESYKVNKTSQTCFRCRRTNDPSSHEVSSCSFDLKIAFCFASSYLLRILVPSMLGNPTFSHVLYTSKNGNQLTKIQNVSFLATTLNVSCVDLLNFFYDVMHLSNGSHFRYPSRYFKKSRKRMVVICQF